jgi:hypothetical protein
MIGTTMNSLYIFTIALFATQVLDFLTTSTILKLPGGYERNPIMSKLFDLFGITSILALKGIIVTVIGYYIGSQYLIIEVLLVGFYSAVIFYNFRSMPK